MSRFLFLTALLISAAAGASAHQDGIPHTHPHLAISNEFLVGILMIAAMALIISVRLAARRRVKSKITDRNRP